MLTANVTKHMSLHQLSEVHGEPGLRARLTLEAGNFPPAHRNRINQALNLASEVHAADRRTREPYLWHVVRVAIRVVSADHLHVLDPDLVIAGLLHDTVEDHPGHLASGTGHLGSDLTEAAHTRITREFGLRVAQLVRGVTNPDFDPSRDRSEQYREHVTSALADPWVGILKLSDYIDNAAGIWYSIIGPRTTRLASKYLPLVPVFRELVARQDCPLDAGASAYAARQLDLAETRLTATLSA